MTPLLHAQLSHLAIAEASHSRDGEEAVHLLEVSRRNHDAAEAGGHSGDPFPSTLYRHCVCGRVYPWEQLIPLTARCGVQWDGFSGERVALANTPCCGATLGKLISPVTRRNPGTRKLHRALERGRALVSKWRSRVADTVATVAPSGVPSTGYSSWDAELDALERALCR